MGRVFLIPKLKAEYEAMKLFGPGEKAATEINNKKAIKSDPYKGIEDVLDQTVEEIATSFNKTVRGVKTVLTRRGLACANYTPKAGTKKRSEKRPSAKPRRQHDAPNI